MLLPFEIATVQSDEGIHLTIDFDFICPTKMYGYVRPKLNKTFKSNSVFEYTGN